MATSSQKCESGGVPVTAPLKEREGRVVQYSISGAGGDSGSCNIKLPQCI
jgi:hypothetical protein